MLLRRAGAIAGLGDESWPVGCALKAACQSAPGAQGRQRAAAAVRFTELVERSHQR